MGASKLVIVESPAKAATIEGYLGPDYHVTASIGHIRDLPQPKDLPADMKKGPYGRFAVSVDDGFVPYYAVNPDKKKKITELKRALKEADELYLATDEDREGEAIAWHLLEVLKPKIPVKRMVFHEITREAIARALDNTRELDTDLVDAQETRRILDRLYGYEISPLLWRKIRPSLSAGRVQSVATRLVVDRERERMRHISAEYWSIDTVIESGGQSFAARVVSVDGHAVATGSDFSEQGQLSDKAVKAGATHIDAQRAQALAQALAASSSSMIDSVTQKPYRRRPAAPFTTSTLQQEASRKLHWNAASTMRTAQSLYESGYITYMRTDSTALSSQAISAARSQAAELYGRDAVAQSPRVYGKVAKGAQEAHEAIRPAGDHFRTPDEVSGMLSRQQLALYDLIWKRTVASQMADAVGFTATIRVLTGVSVDGERYDVISSASGTVITAPGFRLAYEEGRDKGRYDKESARSEIVLPQVNEGDEASVEDATAEGHQTQPPGRYTEATLVKTMEDLGIGRPSTYAATIQTIGDRGYVTHRGQYLVPTWLAFSVTRLLEDNLANLVDYDFTASMETDLDRIAAGQEDRTEFLTHFFLGEDGTGTTGGLQHQVESLGDDIDARAVNSMSVGEGVVVRVGRYGPYLEKTDGTRANIPDGIAPDEMTDEKIAELFTLAADDGRELGLDPVTGHMLIAKNGRFGPYVTEILPSEDDAEESASDATEQAAKSAGTKGATRRKKTAVKPRTASLFKSMDLATVTRDDAVKLLSLPREVGVDPVSGDVITAQNGRYGPYLKKGTDSRTLSSEEQLLTISLDEALEIYSQPKTRGRGVAKPPLREFGEDPISQRKVVVKDGRFGPYITDGETNVTVPRAETVEDLTEERAFELLADKRAKGPAPKKRATARKTTTRRTAAKKSTTRKTSSRTK
ncbi:type I DNA topoisomerase [Schaalia sp. ZJ405]|uniref:type I DNA topoisomerase n=1 Tax=Schaalia sp. ZJ405 TaxID=2709403 RepID=UPI0013EBA7EF|nr:type I DNA topoisomerase [Schaalia sp. ZJ405]QPK81494.1 type I DNA topoisomerase [Schaalia sp. ZJ405]